MVDGVSDQLSLLSVRVFELGVAIYDCNGNLEIFARGLASLVIISAGDIRYEFGYRYQLIFCVFIFL